MSPEPLPLLDLIVRAGPEDRFFDSLLLVGPVLIVLIALLGRNPVTLSLAAGYIGAFATYTVFNSLR